MQARTLIAAATALIAVAAPITLAVVTTPPAPTAEAPTNITATQTVLANEAAAPAVSTPNPGECYNLTFLQTDKVEWPATATPVPCTSEHTAQVYATGTLPETARTDARDLVRYLDRNGCTVEDAWASVNANQPKNGVINDPLRINNTFFTATDTDGTPNGRYVCATTVISFRGEKTPTLQTLTRPLADMVNSKPETLGFCSTGSETDQMASRWNTVNCNKGSIWHVNRWVLLNKAFDTYPGQSEITAMMDRKCGPASPYTFPTEKDWKNGKTTGWCHSRKN